MGFLRDFIQGAAQATPGAVENANVHAEQAKLNAIRQQANTIQENTNTQLQETKRQEMEMNRTKGIMDNFFSVLSIADPTKRAPALDFLSRQGEQSGAGVPKETLSLLKKLTKDEAIALEDAYNDFSAQNPSIMMTPDFFRTAMSNPAFVAKFLSDKAEKAEREQTSRSLQGGTPARIGTGGQNTGTQPGRFGVVGSQITQPSTQTPDTELSKLRRIEKELIDRGSDSDLKRLPFIQKRIASLEQQAFSSPTAAIGAYITQLTTAGMPLNAAIAKAKKEFPSNESQVDKLIAILYPKLKSQKGTQEIQEDTDQNPLNISEEILKQLEGL